MSMELYLIRHAQSANNAKPESQRIPDPPITDLGHEQARRLARRLSSLGLTRVITSPFLRTLQTAEKIQSETFINPEVRIDLHEEGGCYSGYLPSNIAGQPGLNRCQIE
jgi:2,3-bisphosphoglycerate-dependent phosphoglycerate mutase